MNILIIGNGFDLAHGLKTGYGDFLDIIKTYGRSNVKLKDTDAIDPKHFCFKYAKAVRRIYRSDVFKYMISRRTANKGWIDFENELREIVEGASEFPECLVEDRSSQRRNSFGIIYHLSSTWAQKASVFMYVYITHHIKPDNQQTQNIYVDEIKKDIYSQISDFIELFRKYICWIDNEQVPNAEGIELFYKLHIDMLLSFNYTSTAPSIYGQFWDLKDENICYIHGQVSDNQENHIVMGIGSEFYDAFKHSDFLPFFKFYQSYKYETDNTYLNWINEIKRGIFYSNSGHNSDYDPNKCTIYIYGHSLDPTDKSMLLPFLDISDNRTPVEIIIYYLDDGTRLSMEKNLVKILGREKFSEYLCGEDSRIKFRAIPADKSSLPRKILAISG